MACSKWRAFRKTVQRRRVFPPEQLEAGNLKRCLTRWDLTGLGLGSTLGVGVYVLVGSVALRMAGPSIVLSFLVAAVASLFAGACYAEFGSRVPRAGTAYIYAYVTVGELAAFVVGWNMILEGLFGAASVARGLSSYVDSMLGGAMTAWFTSVAPVSGLAPFSAYFDFFAFFLVLLFGVVLAVGARESSMVNNVFAILNMIVILFIVIAGAFTANSMNWRIPESEVPVGFGSGGFFPYGAWGTLQAAAVCFYGFVGFDTISATGEEVKEPRRTIPLAILTVLGIVLLTYASISIVITLMVPYYMLDKVAAVATAFTFVGWEWARWIVSIGAVFGIFASLFGAMFPLPRLLYAMASDGLLVHWFSKVSAGRRSPIIATVVPACVIAVLSACVELEQLILMMSIGTLLSYTIVAACVVVVRYRSTTKSELGAGYLKQTFGCGSSLPSGMSSRIVDVTLTLFVCVCVAMALVGTKMERPLITIAVLHVVALVLLVVMTLQPQTKTELAFKTPLVPIVPCLSIYINVHLMILVNVQTWIRIVIWILIGLPIYALCVCCYKRKKNLENNIIAFSHKDLNGKSPVQIKIDPPTPSDTMKRSSNYGSDHFKDIHFENDIEILDVNDNKHVAMRTDEIIIQHAIIENNEEKEAKIIDLLDQVLQAEEDSYVEEIISLKEQIILEDNNTNNVETEESIPHRKSLSELSDAGSDASLGIQVLSIYDVIAQVHREDLPKVNEEEEKTDLNEEEEKNDMNEEIEEHEQVTAFNDSETNSRTDESGYSDTIDRNALNDSTEDCKEDVPNIPIPPPFDEDYFATPYFKKAYTVPARVTREKPLEEEENKPRESIQSNNSQDDGNITFGSDRQMSFMSKLNNIFQTKISTEGEEQRKRSNSTGDMAEGSGFALNKDRPAIFMEMKKELLLLHSAPNLRPVNVEEKKPVEENQDDEEEAEEVSLSRQDLKSKLESMYATGGPKLFKPRPMKSNPPAAEEPCTDTSTESITKLPKMDKNDTLKRQKDKFGAVLNSFRLSLNNDDEI